MTEEIYRKLDDKLFITARVCATVFAYSRAEILGIFLKVRHSFDENN